ncbi:SAM-dependent methyltransferase [Variovorax sp. TBS-050B]|uniref:class I SAM-dependent methyltransferase n=1 Tax=Variovorax sp. TBS-050B TaxID=2940551 RepID=UPI00247404D2|nr:class I SAM-dependent methyltransferase [Variovorax sp. TBS-050B]MDH6591654.1 SAM-dependent methyltransferase [Variovorax sp. TBS-050B]
MAAPANNELLSDVSSYYETKLAAHGETARGVDWNGEASQSLRFEQLCKIIAEPEGFSINDLGCGYGALNEYLALSFAGFSYNGFDISEAMVAAAQRRQGANAMDVSAAKRTARFVAADRPDGIADYGIASGIFNVRLDWSEAAWQSYLDSTLDVLDQTSRRGFAFNCLTSYSDPDKMRDHLHYADPCRIFDRCKRRYSRNVALLHDYGLYEFTILVRKQP